jgi:hypothetical protein
MKHYKKGERSLKAMHMIAPERKTINGVVHICFRDIIHNLLVNEINGAPQDFTAMTENIKRKSNTKLSPKHRKRIERQVGKLTGGGIK